MDAYSIEFRVVCNRNLRDFVVTIQGFRLKFGRRFVLGFPQIATVDSRRLKHSPVKGVSTRSANSTVFYPPCKQFSKIIFSKPRCLPRFSREARSIGRARSVSTTFHKFATTRSQSHVRIASYRIETHGFLRNSRDTADLFRALH